MRYAALGSQRLNVELIWIVARRLACAPHARGFVRIERLPLAWRVSCKLA